MISTNHTDDYYYDIVRVNIRKFRMEKGYTLQKLADEAGLSIDYVAEIESLKRRKSFSLAALGRIADALEVNIKEFFNENVKK